MKLKYLLKMKTKTLKMQTLILTRNLPLHLQLGHPGHDRRQRTRPNSRPGIREPLARYHPPHRRYSSRRYCRALFLDLRSAALRERQLMTILLFADRPLVA